MKRICILLFFAIAALPLKAQINYLDTLVTDQFLKNVYPDGFKVESGGFDTSKNMYISTEFFGETDDWEITIETNRKGRISGVYYDYKKYPRRSMISSSSELIELADSIIDIPGVQINTRELNDDSNGESNLYYEVILPFTRTSPMKTLFVKAQWDHNRMGNVFFYGLSVVYIMNDH